MMRSPFHPLSTRLDNISSIEDDREMIAWDYIKERDSLSQTDAYWRLNEARWR